MSTADTSRTTSSRSSRPLPDTEPQTAGGKVLLHFTMSLDGFVAGPDHAMGWMTGASVRPGLIEEYAETTGAVLGAGVRLFDNPEVFPSAWSCSTAMTFQLR